MVQLQPFLTAGAWSAVNRREVHIHGGMESQLQPVGHRRTLVAHDVSRVDGLRLPASLQVLGLGRVS